MYSKVYKMRYRLTLSYDGSAFSGWQIQNNARTIQDIIQHSLSVLLKEEVTVTGAGRTDAGVNAINYIAHFDSDVPDLDADNLGYKLNAILPKEITVHKIVTETVDFHARFDAKSREYHYFIHRSRDPFAERYSYFCGYNINLEEMNKAAAYLLGTHDFSCFEKKGGSNRTSICTVYEAEWTTYTPTHVGLLGYPAKKDDYIVFRIRADRFLRNMVRAIVGSLIDVGRGKREAEWIRTLTLGGERSCAGESVPGKALFLNKVDY